MKFSNSIPFYSRELAGQIERILGISLGVPMTVKISNISPVGERSVGSYSIHWPALTVTGRVETSDLPFGGVAMQGMDVLSLRANLGACATRQDSGIIHAPITQLTADRIRRIGGSAMFNRLEGWINYWVNIPVADRPILYRLGDLGKTPVPEGAEYETWSA